MSQEQTPNNLPELEGQDFKLSAQQALRERDGYASATVLEFKCLGGEPGYDEDDYELKVQVGAEHGGNGGGKGSQIIPIIVRRASPDALRS